MPSSGCVNRPPTWREAIPPFSLPEKPVWERNWLPDTSIKAAGVGPNPLKPLIAPLFPIPYLKANFSGMLPVPLRAPPEKGKPVFLQRPMGAPSFSMKWVVCRSPIRPRCFGFWKTEWCSVSAMKKKRRVDVRIVSASNMDLKRGVGGGAFHSGFVLPSGGGADNRSPSEGKSPGHPLAGGTFCGHAEKVFCRKATFMDSPMRPLAHLKEYGWPGNVRELKNLVEYAMNMVRNRNVEMKDLAFLCQTAGPGQEEKPPVRPPEPECNSRKHPERRCCH